MGLARMTSVAFMGLDPLPVTVEVDVRGGKDFTVVMVGLPDAAVRESKDRVISAIRNSNFQLDSCHITINLAPGDLKKEGPWYDLPIALGMLEGEQQIPQGAGEDFLIVGELGLSGELRPIRGALGMAMLARDQGKKGLILPRENAAEGAAVPGIAVIGVETLNEAAEVLRHPEKAEQCCSPLDPELFTPPPPLVDFADIRGQSHVKRALEIAAAGGHNALLSGPPGSGKTMLAKAIVGIMPDMSVEEALETTKVHSIAGQLEKGQSVVARRPFRSPHHTVSYAGLIGGGSYPRPGEVSLAHNGVLFLDELPEFSRHSLEILRQPLEDLEVTISRAQGNLTFPANFVCIAAMNPCPCGYLGHPSRPCRDSQHQIERYRGKISGPLLDRIDMHLDVPCLSYDDYSGGGDGESSAEVKGRVMEARKRQRERFGSPRTNSQMLPREIREYCHLDGRGEERLRQAVQMGMSARAHGRILRVARTIADLEGEERVGEGHLLEAIHYRQKEAEEMKGRQGALVG